MAAAFRFSQFRFSPEFMDAEISNFIGGEAGS
jgi:hypothetical protein